MRSVTRRRPDGERMWLSPSNVTMRTGPGRRSLARGAMVRAGKKGSSEARKTAAGLVNPSSSLRVAVGKARIQFDMLQRRRDRVAHHGVRLRVRAHPLQHAVHKALVGHEPVEHAGHPYPDQGPNRARAEPCWHDERCTRDPSRREGGDAEQDPCAVGGPDHRRGLDPVRIQHVGDPLPVRLSPRSRAYLLAFAGLPDGVGRDQAVRVRKTAVPLQDHGVGRVAPVEAQHGFPCGRSSGEHVGSTMARLNPILAYLDIQPRQRPLITRLKLRFSLLRAVDQTRPGTGARSRPKLLAPHRSRAVKPLPANRSTRTRPPPTQPR